MVEYIGYFLMGLGVAGIIVMVVTNAIDSYKFRKEYEKKYECNCKCDCKK